MKTTTRICKNCDDFDSKNNVCEIRYLIKIDGSKVPLTRKANQKGCEVFMLKTESK